MEQITELLLNEGQKMIYGRRRIIDVLHQKDERYCTIQATDISSITLQDDLVCCPGRGC